MYAYRVKTHGCIEENKYISIDLHCATLILILSVFSI